VLLPPTQNNINSLKMAGLETHWRHFFPLKNIGDILKLFRHELAKALWAQIGRK
jgi:hypothetical protein